MGNTTKLHGLEIKWLNHHAGFQITGSKTIVIDPYDIQSASVPDLLFVTHSHYDHFSPDDIEKIRGTKTIVIGPPEVAKKIGGNVKSVEPGDTFEIDGVKVEVVESYNINKSFHPKSHRGVGYLITMDKIKIYHSGDTDLIPEMKNIRADIVLLPCGGTYTMTAKEAAQAATSMKPELAIPMHWGKLVGSRKDAEEFKSSFNGRSEILE